jgi:hypothetical protein
MPITRFQAQQTAAVTATLASTAEIHFGDFTSGTVHIPSGSSITTLTWYTSDEPGGTFLAAYDSDLTAPAAIVQTVAAGCSYPIPFDLAGARALKAVGNAAGNIDVSMKS